MYICPMNKKTAGTAVFLFFSLFLILCTVSCSRAGLEKAVTDEELPDMIMTEASYTLGRPDRTPLRMQARTITIYSERNRTVLEEPVFTQKAKDSEEIELEGSCKRAESFDNENVTLEGNVRVMKKSDNVTIECDNLIWDDKTSSLSTDGLVKLSYKDGTRMTARGFRALLDSDTYEFTEILEGRYSDDQVSE